jgi:hypothetical protein
VFEIKMTINGKPFSEQTFQDEMEKAILQNAAEQIKEIIRSSLSVSEFAQIKLNFKGTVDNFGVEIDGPEEIIEKAQAALQQE